LKGPAPSTFGLLRPHISILDDGGESGDVFGDGAVALLAEAEGHFGVPLEVRIAVKGPDGLNESLEGLEF
jgi:hypothetical protein